VDLHTFNASATGPASSERDNPVDSSATHGRAVRLLTDLVRELAVFGFQVTMSDAVPALVIYSANRRRVLEVAVRGDYFEWHHGEDSHLVTDPAGAAAAMAAEAWKRAGEAWAARRPGTPGESS
jgi:hypothetical protein